MNVRFLRIIEKNFKLLFRSKSSAFILFIGPIVIIVLVGFFFSGKSGYDLSIGYYSPKETVLTKDFISALEESEFVVFRFNTEQDCVSKIKQGIIHTCIIFPKDFEIRNSKASDLRFIVDYSRINLVYKVIDAVSGIIEFETRSVSKGLTAVLLDNINQTISDMRAFEDVQKNVSAQERLIRGNLDNSLLAIASMDFEASSIKTDKLEFDTNRLNKTFDDFINQSFDLVEFSFELLEDLDGYIDSNESEELLADLTELNDTLTQTQNLSYLHMTYLFSSVSDLSYSVDLIVGQLEKNKELSAKTKQELMQAGTRLDSLKKTMNDLSEATYAVRRRLESISITKADVIVNPINTKIEPLVAESSNLQFTFPFLIVLIIMFASLMIASTLVIFEKSSRALFRNFMAPISEKAFILASFVTVLMIILVQTIVILFISQLALSLDLFSNFFSVVFIVFIAAVFFSVLGMLIGYLFSSQEGSVMASLVVGSVFLFLSNLVVPLESIAPALSKIIRFNPFIIFSDLLRKSLLFEAPFTQTLIPLSVLLLISSAILLGILYLKGFFTRHRVKMPGPNIGFKK